jgi:nicotinamide-nucleotide amidase
MQIFPPHLLTLASAIIDAARNKKMMIATAESCTGGLIGGCLTEIPGSSDVFDRGFIVYSNDAKMAHLNVSRKTIADFGAVSAETALEMAEGALRASNADIAVSVTGIAGPGGGSAEKPVGLVYLGVALRRGDKSYILKNMFEGDRGDVRVKTVETALAMLKKEIENF